MQQYESQTYLINKLKEMYPSIASSIDSSSVSECLKELNIKSKTTSPLAWTSHSQKGGSYPATDEAIANKLAIAEPASAKDSRLKYKFHVTKVLPMLMEKMGKVGDRRLEPMVATPAAEGGRAVRWVSEDALFKELLEQYEGLTFITKEFIEHQIQEVIVMNRLYEPTEKRYKLEIPQPFFKQEGQEILWNIEAIYIFLWAKFRDIAYFGDLNKAAVDLREKKSKKKKDIDNEDRNDYDSDEERDYDHDPEID